MLIPPFTSPKPVIGVIHVGALPGTPAGALGVEALAEQAAGEAAAYREGGVDGIIVENMHDVPYLRGRVGPEVVAAMTVVGREVKRAAGLAVGVQFWPGPTSRPWPSPTPPASTSSAPRATSSATSPTRAGSNRPPPSCSATAG